MHRVFVAALAVTLPLMMSGDVLACSLSGSKLFRPTLERWDQHPGPAQEDPESKGDFWEKVPAPAVRVVGITRGRSDDGSSCEDAGTVSFEISLPEESTYTIDEFAFYFRVSGRQEPDEIFPSVPVLGVVEGRAARVSFAWLDGHPARQSPLDMTVEVFLVTNDLTIGPSTVFRVRAEKGRVPDGRPH